MSDNPLDRIPSFDRVSIRAVVVEDGEDPGKALSEAGILDPVAIPVAVGEDPPESSFGDGMTPNVTAVLVPDHQDGEEDDNQSQASVSSRARAVQQVQPAPATRTLPAAYGMQSLAPVRQRDG